jgi:hypothetical protein
VAVAVGVVVVAAAVVRVGAGVVAVSTFDPAGRALVVDAVPVVVGTGVAAGGLVVVGFGLFLLAIAWQR